MFRSRFGGVTFGAVACAVSALVVCSLPSLAFGDESLTESPGVVFTVSPPAETNKTTADFVFEASGATTCRLDEQEPTECVSPITVPDLKDGAHTFTVTSSDGASATHQWTVDTVKPIVIFRSSIRQEGNKVPYTNETSASFTYSTTDPTAVLQCRMPASVGYTYFNLSDGRRARIPVPGGPYVSCPPSPHTLSGLAEGDHIVNVRAIDPAGNITTTGLHWRVDYEYVPPDTTPPTVTFEPLKKIDPHTYELAFQVSEESTLRCWHNTGSITSGTSRPLESCTSPITLTDVPEGRNEISVEATDPSGNRAKAGRGWTVDRTPPEVLISSAPEAVSGPGSIFRFSSSESATAQILECSLDQGPWRACASPVELKALSHGPHTFAIRATDGHGNVSEPIVTEWSVDAEGPEARIADGPDRVTASTEAAFTISTSGDATSLECALDDADWSACKPSISLTGLTEGRHEFRVRAIDSVGNAGPVALHQWEIDRTGPEVTIGSSVSGTSPATSARFQWSSEPGATFSCRLDGRQWAACTSPTVVSSLANGSHTFEVRAADRLGNQGPAAGHSWITELPAPPEGPTGPPPTVTITSGPPEKTNSRVAEFTVSHTPGSTLSCRSTAIIFPFLVGWRPCPEPFSFAGLAEGSHTLEVRATNPDGRISSVKAWVWRVDATAPRVTLRTTPLATTTSTLAEFTFWSTERDATFLCRLDSATWTACSSPVEFRDLDLGKHTFEVIATDFVGNRSAITAHAWEVVKPDSDYSVFGEPDQGGEPLTEPEPAPDSQPEQEPNDPLPGGESPQSEEPVTTGAQPKGLSAPRILSGPSRTDSRRPLFRLSAPAPGTTNLCSVDRGRPVVCGSTWRPAGRLSVGAHTLRIRVRAADGTLSATDVHRFRVTSTR